MQEELQTRMASLIAQYYPFPSTEILRCLIKTDSVDKTLQCIEFSLVANVDLHHFLNLLNEKEPEEKMTIRRRIVKLWNCIWLYITTR